MFREADTDNRAEAYEALEGKRDQTLLDWVDGAVSGRRRGIVTETDRKHVVMVLKGIISELFEINPCGSFGQHVIMADLGAACQADDTCILFLDVFYKYLYNCVPQSKWTAARSRLLKQHSAW